MIRKRILLLLLAVMIALPAAAYEFSWTCRGTVKWGDNDVTFQPSLASFPYGSGWNASVEAMRHAWNNVPGSNYRIHYTWVSSASASNNDNKNSILIADPADWKQEWTDKNWVAVAIGRYSLNACYPSPWPRPSIAEKDILFSPYASWNTAINPQPPSFGLSSTLVGIHEHGHGLGLAHEDDIMATMNSVHPMGGPISTRNDAVPHADDTKAVRVAYGTATTARDVAASAYNRTSPGNSRPIVPPQTTDRGAFITFPFTVMNRGTVNETSVPIYFYLTPTRNSVSTSSFFIGSAMLSMNAGTSSTLSVTLTIPSNAPVSYQYLAWIVDPFNSIPETDEGNNGVTMANQTYVYANLAPTACFSANPTSGSTPFYVQVDASCSSDPEGQPLTYEWDFGDGNTATGVTASNTYWSSGFYYITLTVTDAWGSRVTTTRRVSAFCDTQFCPEEPL